MRKYRVGEIVIVREDCVVESVENGYRFLKFMSERKGKPFRIDKENSIYPNTYYLRDLDNSNSIIGCGWSGKWLRKPTIEERKKILVELL